MRKTLFVILVLLLSSPSAASASEPIDTSLIAHQNAQIENILNSTESRIEAIRFLHRHISEDARFVISPDSPSGEPLEIGKADYINGLIGGAGGAENYRLRIDTLGTTPLPGSSETMTQEILTAQGVAQGPANPDAPGKSFVSRSVCRIVHAMENGELVAKGGECRTTLSFEDAT